MTARDSNLIAIKEGLYSISKQLTVAPKSRPSNDVKALASKIYNSVQMDNSPVERFYFIYLLCQLCSEKPNRLDKLMKIIIPSQPTPQLLSLISDIISFTICHPSQYASMLEYFSDYVSDSESIEVKIESWYQAETLAFDCPKFCASLVSRSDLIQLGIDKKLLAKWLQDLSKTPKISPKVSLNNIIRYSLFEYSTETSPEAGSTQKSSRSNVIDSDLHFSILTIIQCARCIDLTNQFLIDVVNNLVNKLEQAADTDEEKVFQEQVIDRFAQILSVAAATKVASITNALKASLAKLESNRIIAALIRWQNK